MKGKRFSEITDASGLIAYLNEPQRLNNVKSFNKYMQLFSVERLFSTGMLLINNPGNMNDRYEYDAFISHADWSKICFCSFITQSTESMAMWSMYAQPWAEGVMLSFPADALKRVVHNTVSLISVSFDEKNRYIPGKDTIPSDGILSFARIVYFSGTTITCTSREDRNVHFRDPYSISKLAGYVKDAAWDYEKEVRLRVDLPKTYQQNAVFLKLPDSLLSQATILTGPRFKGNVLTALPERFRPLVNIEPSKFNGKLAWTPCDTCEKNKE